ADLALQRGVDQLVLAHPRQAAEHGRCYLGAIVVAVAGEILDRDLGVGKGLAKLGLQIGGGHRHAKAPRTGISERKPLTSPASPVRSISQQSQNLWRCDAGDVRGVSVS